MPKRSILYLSISFTISLIIISVLLIVAHKRESVKNGFQRVLISRLRDLKVLDLGFNSFYFAGGAKQVIYLGNYTDPSFVVTSNPALSDTHHILIDLPKNRKIAQRFLLVKIDSPFIYMFENITPLILAGNIHDQRVDILPLHYSGFINWLPLSLSSMFVTAYDSSIHENIIVKLNEKDSFSRSFSQILPKQFPGTFSVNGMLNFDKAENRLVFVYLYRNEFICLDSNLKILYKAHTIDTNSIAKIKIGNFDSGKYSTFSAPPLTVNAKSCISENRLFICSGLKADNESQSSFSQNIVIDVYNLLTGKYENSFYIPKFKNLPLRSFIIVHQTLAAVFDRYLIAYTIRP
jgi:hypothetical protein